MLRHDGRRAGELRQISVQAGFVKSAAGSVLVSAGDTMILCAASVSNDVPPWRRPRNDGDPVSGWVTAEYSMLPGSTSPRKQRDRLKVDGRTTEIQRLIGRSLRSVVDFEALGEHTIVVDCDVLQADGGTRTLSITGGWIAMALALKQLEMSSSVLTDSVAAISVGIVAGVPLLDLNYPEDSTADVDMNVVMTGSGRFVEIQGTAESDPFSDEQLQQQLALAGKGIRELAEIQRAALA